MIAVITAPDERERCMAVTAGTRCPARAAWIVGDIAGLDYACVCADHVNDVRRPGEAARRIDQQNEHTD